MAAHSDGGRVALAGFLYQIVGTLWLRANGCLHDISADEADVSALASFDRDTSIMHEEREDALLRGLELEGDFRVAFVQFKYSGQTPPRKMYQADMIEIVKRMAVSAGDGVGQKNGEVGYFVITNRPQVCGWRDLDDSGAFGKNPVATCIWESIRVVTREFTDFSEKLGRFARNLACTEDEFRDGVRHLIGDLIERTRPGTGSIPVDESHLIKAFTGHGGARQVTHAVIAASLNEESEEYLKGHITRGSVVPRMVEKEITDLIDRDRRALIVVHGQGGSGKSVSLAQWACERNRLAWPKFGCFLAVHEASAVSPGLITRRLCDLAALPHNHARRSNREEQAIERLEIANPGAPRPVAVLCLDGLDEASRQANRGEELAVLLGRFWAEDKRSRAADDPGSPCALIVTCRNVDEVHDLLNLDPSCCGIVGPRPAEVRVNVFETDELVLAARKDLDASVAARFSATARVDSTKRRGDLDEGFPTDRSPLALAPVRSDVFKNLRDPVIWRAFLGLDEPALQSRVLDGDPEAVRSLAAAFTAWFCRKARKRLGSAREGEIREHLRTVARSSPSPDRFHSKSAGWIDPLCTIAQVGRPQAERLYEEAVSAGYIIDEKTRWRWQYAMCADDLLSPE